ncbi:MAG: hypothetical protein M3Q63_03755 [bacterium]|nr:hypothetical protein [bacterium]
MDRQIGKKIDPSELVDVFSHGEGEIQQLIGGIGQGKTYEATRQVLELLKQGKTVYTNWQLTLPDTYDERKSLAHTFWNFVFFRRNYYVFDYKKNWHYYDMDRNDIVDYIASLTDCYVFCDEGQDLFDSYEGTKMSKQKRKSLTRTRHLRKTLVLVSQRAQAIAVTARANVNTFYKTVKKFSIIKPYFQIWATEDVDSQNFPIWEEATIVHRGFASKEVFSAYNSWYLSNGIPRSQQVHFEAYQLNFFQRLQAFLGAVAQRFSAGHRPKKALKPQQQIDYDIDTVERREPLKMPKPHLQKPRKNILMTDIMRV